MKKTILFLAIIISGVTLNAQVQFGLKAGLNNSIFGGDSEFPGKKSNTGFNFGVVANIPISTDFAFQPEIMYSGNQGMEFRPFPTVENNYTLNYVNIPLMLQYKSSGFFGEIGPYFGFLTSGKIKTKNGNNTTEVDVKNSFDGTDIGAAAGIGYILKSGLGIGARYNMGFSNIYDGTNLEFKNRVWQVDLIYMFSSKTK